MKVRGVPSGSPGRNNSRAKKLLWFEISMQPACQPQAGQQLIRLFFETQRQFIKRMGTLNISVLPVTSAGGGGMGLARFVSAMASASKALLPELLTTCVESTFPLRSILNATATVPAPPEKPRLWPLM